MNNISPKEGERMPIVTIQMAEGRTAEQKRTIVQSITNLLVTHLEVKPEWVTVLIEEFDRENWATGGELHSDR